MSDTAPIVVWSEIPVSDLDRSIAFYNAVFGWKMTIDTSGPNPMANLGGNTETIGGHLYPGKPGKGAGPTIHIAVPDTVEEAMQRAEAAGGTPGAGPIEIPPGRFAYVSDPDGNSLGLFEPRG